MPQQTSDQRRPAPQPDGVPAGGGTSHPTSGFRRWLTVPRIVGLCVAVATVAILLRGLLTPAAQPTVNVDRSGTVVPLPASPLVGHLAPDVYPLDLAGKRVALSDLRGKVVVLNFWYVACEPCQLEMPALERAYQSDAAKGLVVIGLNTADDAPTITQFARGLGVTYPLWRDVGDHAVITYSVTATPTSYIIDRQGVIRARYLGPFDQKTLDSYLQPLLA